MYTYKSGIEYTVIVLWINTMATFMQWTRTRLLSHHFSFHYLNIPSPLVNQNIYYYEFFGAYQCIVSQSSQFYLKPCVITLQFSIILIYSWINDVIQSIALFLLPLNINVCETNHAFGCSIDHASNNLSQIWKGWGKKEPFTVGGSAYWYNHCEKSGWIFLKNLRL